MTRGGKRPGAGRPKGSTTTNSTTTTPVYFRLTKAQRNDLDSISNKPNLFAKAATLAAVRRAKRRTPGPTKGP